VQKYTLGDVGN